MYRVVMSAHHRGTHSMIPGWAVILSVLIILGVSMTPRPKHRDGFQTTNTDASPVTSIGSALSSSWGSIRDTWNGITSRKDVLNAMLGILAVFLVIILIVKSMVRRD